MKRLMACCVLALAAPALSPQTLSPLALSPLALAQPAAAGAEAEGRAVIDRWISAFNRGDVAGLSRDVYLNPDTGALTGRFKALRAESFGKLDVYGVSVCLSDPARGRALLRYGKLYTYGGLMDGDEAMLFDIVRTPGGWRISTEARVAYDAPLSCS